MSQIFKKSLPWLISPSSFHLTSLLPFAAKLLKRMVNTHCTQFSTSSPKPSPISFGPHHSSKTTGWDQQWPSTLDISVAFDWLVTPPPWSNSSPGFQDTLLFGFPPTSLAAPSENSLLFLLSLAFYCRRTLLSLCALPGELIQAFLSLSNPHLCVLV